MDHVYRKIDNDNDNDINNDININHHNCKNGMIFHSFSRRLT